MNYFLLNAGMVYRALVCNGGDNLVDKSTVCVISEVSGKKEGPCQTVFFVVLLCQGGCNCSLSRTKGSMD